MTDEILNGIVNPATMSELDLIADIVALTMIEKWNPTKVVEKDFIKKHDIISIDRNDYLLILLSTLQELGGFKVYYDSSGVDIICFFVGKDLNKAYTKRYKSDELEGDWSGFK